MASTEGDLTFKPDPVGANPLLIVQVAAPPSERFKVNAVLVVEDAACVGVNVSALSSD